MSFREHTSIEGGEFSIQSQGDALQAETSLAISDGTFHIIAGGGSGNLFSRPQGSRENPDSGWDLSDMTQASAKGLKCGREIVVTGGSFFVDSYDDAVHSNGAVRILGGSLTLAAGDDGIHGDMELEITGGDIRITKSYEGLEANQISIEGGVVDIVADDDAVVFSSPELVLGETYILSVGGETVEITLDAVSTISGRRGGWGW